MTERKNSTDLNLYFVNGYGIIQNLTISKGRGWWGCVIPCFTMLYVTTGTAL